MAVTYTPGYTFKAGEDVGKDVLAKKLNAALTAFTFTAINGVPIGATTPSTGAFTTLSATGAVQLGNAYVVQGGLTATGYVTIKDSTGTTYRIPVLV